MNVSVSGKNMNVGEALRSRIEAELSDGISKYFERGGDAAVSVSPDGHGYRVDCTVNLASGRTIIGHGHGGDAHAAFDDVLGKIQTRVRRYKRKLKNHHIPGGKGANPDAEETLPLIVLQAPGDDDADDDDQAAGQDGNGADDQPLVIAETETPIRSMTVSMAVLELDLRGYPVLLFRNVAHGGLSLVYRRPDGNIGWIDPQRMQQAS